MVSIIICLICIALSFFICAISFVIDSINSYKLRIEQEKMNNYLIKKD